MHIFFEGHINLNNPLIILQNKINFNVIFTPIINNAKIRKNQACKFAKVMLNHDDYSYTSKMYKSCTNTRIEVLSVKINFNPNLPIYNKTEKQSQTKPLKTEAKAIKTDVIDFSKGRVAPPDKETASLRSRLLRDINATTSKGRLATLKEKIKNGDYHPSTQDIVDAIIGKDETKVD